MVAQLLHILTILGLLILITLAAGILMMLWIAFCMVIKEFRKKGGENAGNDIGNKERYHE